MEDVLSSAVRVCGLILYVAKILPKIAFFGSCPPKRYKKCDNQDNNLILLKTQVYPFHSAILLGGSNIKEIYFVFKNNSQKKYNNIIRYFSS